MIAFSVYATRLRLCRSCAQALGRAAQDRTLLAGWWGVLAWFRNLWIVWRNTRGLAAARAMPAPTRHPAVESLTASPLPPGRPVFLRPDFALVAAVVAVVILVAAVGMG